MLPPAGTADWVVQTQAREDVAEGLHGNVPVVAGVVTGKDIRGGRADRPAAAKDVERQISRAADIARDRDRGQAVPAACESVAPPGSTVIARFTPKSSAVVP
jgi:hypothetical protein